MIEGINNIREIIDTMNLEALLIKSKTLKKYLKIPTGSGIHVLITKENQYLILDGRYIQEARETTSDFQIIENTPSSSKRSHFHMINEILKKHGLKSLGIETNGYSINDYIKLKEYNLDISLVEEDLDKARIIKNHHEIEIIKEACKITDEIFLKTLSHIKVGISENEINALIHYYALKAGASKLSFEPVITSGIRTAFPHGRPTDRKVKVNEPIMIDFGIEYKNYQSDMTRTIFIGRPSDEMTKIYEIVKKAQQAGVNAIKSGEITNKVDYLVRRIIEDEGYGEYYNHGLGHGIGIGDGREYPFLNETSETILMDGMVMSCEPGIYVPGLGGVRIEDDVLIKDGVGISLNKTTKEMIILEG